METKKIKDTLSIDLETYSDVSLKDCGVYKYVESPNFEILLCSFSLNGGPVETYELAVGDELPQSFIDALTDPNIIKEAHNAQFERVCLTKYLYGDFEHFLDPSQWVCTMAHASILGLPSALEKVGEALGLSEDKKKLNTGKALIRYFSVPSKTKGRLRNLPYHDMERWRLYAEYNNQDVVTEIEIEKKLSLFPIPTIEQKVYALDQRINDRGTRLDMELVRYIIDYNNAYQEELVSRAKEITGLDNPNSNNQLLGWLKEKEDGVTSVKKEAVADLIKSTKNEDVREMLKLRQEMTKTSLKKYDTMERAVCDDDRIRGVLMYYGANRTGRWAGRLVQVQNLPRNSIEELDDVRALVKAKDFETLDMLYDNVPDILSQLIRTAFIAKEGKTFVVCDYSAIEARVIAWLAREKWRQEVFNHNGDIYCESASQMFNVPVVKHGENGHLRQKGKVAELALGYQGGLGALKQMGGERMGLSEEEMMDIIQKWRKASPAIVSLWREVEDCAKRAIRTHSPQRLKHGNITFKFSNGILFIHLPNGRALAYQGARIEGEGRYSKIKYKGMHQERKIWCELDTYGGKLVENIVQAVARDCLARAMLSLDNAGYEIVFHIHDEVVIEVDKNKAQAEYELIRGIMCMPIPWAKGLILNAEGFTNDYYMKD